MRFLREGALVLSFLALLVPAALVAADGEEVEIPAGSKKCVGCHGLMNPGMVDHWRGSRHARGASPYRSTRARCMAE